MKKIFVVALFLLLTPISLFASEIKTEKYINGDMYVGEFSDNVINGYGVYTFGGGGKYEGNFVDGFKSGNGKYTWPDGDIFEGEYVENQMANGTYTWASGEKYIGGWINHKANGQGELIKTNGDRLVGTFLNGNFTGQGIRANHGGSIYEGQFLNGYYDGNGKFSSPDGSVYEGEFSYGQFNGHGIRYYKDVKADGNWLDSKLNGHAVVSSNAGTISGIFYQDQLVKTDDGICVGDTWNCDKWSACSSNGTQTRVCSIYFDCPGYVSPSPQTTKSCAAPSTLTPQKDQEILSGQDSIIKATVKLICFIDEDTASQGSGTVIDSSGKILTNKHVVDGTMGCLVGFINKYTDRPYFNEKQIADIIKVSPNKDAAILQLRNPADVSFNYVNLPNNYLSKMQLGNKIMAYGYPAKFGDNLTYTSGDFSGVEDEYYKTTAILEHGNSGGGAYLSDGTFIGIPSAVATGELNSMGLILSADAVKEWLNNSAVGVAASQNNYSRVSQIVKNIKIENLANLGLKKGINNSNSDIFSKKNSGKILLQVENHGEAWYVNPLDAKRYYMANGDKAYSVMRNFGIGITNKNLEKIKSSKTLAKKYSGKIFLQVESKGEAYYIDFNGVDHYLKDGAAAYQIMRSLGLGITNNDLSKISEGNL